MRNQFALPVVYADAGTVEYGPGGTFGPRVQTSLQLVLVHTGQAKIWVDDASFVVPKGHVALLLPGSTERFEFAREQRTWHRFIHTFVAELAPAVRAELEKLPKYIPLSDKINQLTDMIMVLQQNREEPVNAELLCSLGRSAILTYMSECKSMEAVRCQHPAVLLAKAAVAARYGEPLALADLAKAASVTPEHLIRLFRRDEGMTPTQYVWRFRIERSLEMLRSTGLAIGEIADRTGFKTTYHYARMIKQRTGMTPTELRRQSWDAGTQHANEWR